MTQAKTQFAVTSWEENTWEGKPSREVTGAKRTRARVTYTYEGDMQGSSTIEYLMSYNADASGHFVALEHFTGRIGGRSGSVVLQHVGTFEPVKTHVIVLTGTGTGELTALHGEAHVELDGHQEAYPMTLDYAFD